MAGIEQLWRVQIGLEAALAPGTPVAATKIWPGPAGAFEDQGQWVQVREDLGQHIPKPLSYRPFLGAVLEMPEQPLSFEAFPYVLACGVENIDTGVPDGVGSGKIYEYNQPVATVNTIRTATLEAGDNQQAKEMEYGFVSKFTLSGAKRDAWKMTASWQGRQLTNCTFTAGLARIAAEYALFQNSVLSIDDSGGAIGTTPVQESWLAASLEWTTGWEALYTADGQLYFTVPEFLGCEITGKIVLRHDATGLAELAAAEAGDVRLMEWLIEGSALTTPGAYTKKTIQLQAAIVYTAIPPLTRQDKRSVIELPFTVVDSDAVVPTIMVVNEVAAL